MKKILLITEKPSGAKMFLEQAFEANDKFIIENEIHLAYANAMTSPTYEYPKDAKYKDYPKTTRLKLKWNPKFEEFAPSTKTKPSTEFNHPTSKHTPYNIYKNTKRIWKKSDFDQDFDTLILVPDVDYIGAYFPLSLLEFLYGKDYEKKFNNVYYQAPTSSSGVYPGLYENQDTKRKFLAKLAKSGEFKKWFQYNFNFNSAIFFNEIFSHLGVKTDGPISKFTIQLIHLIYNTKYTASFLKMEDGSLENGKVTERDLLEAMSEYKGSGKYSPEEFNFVWSSQIGSPATRGMLVERLYVMGLLKREGKAIKKTSLGEGVFSLLNKKTFDIDMSFRVSRWEDDIWKGKDVYGGAADYIKEYFIGQKRKNNKTLRGDK